MSSLHEAFLSTALSGVIIIVMSDVISDVISVISDACIRSAVQLGWHAHSEHRFPAPSSKLSQI